jgi:hypothetical protein
MESVDSVFYSFALPVWEEHIMMKFWVVIFMSLALALPAFSAGNKTYQTNYPVSCNQVWSAVKAALSNPNNYKDVQSDDEKMVADYNVKHSIHWSVAGAINQGKNKVSLVPVGNACEMNVVSMYSGLSHNDAGDFKKRVDEALEKSKASKPGEPAKPAGEAK